MKKLLVILITCLFVPTLMADTSRMSTSEILDTLDMYISKLNHFEGLQRNKIRESKTKLKSLDTLRKPREYLTVADLYFTINIDSALYYLDLGRQYAGITGDKENDLLLHMGQLGMSPHKGMVHHAIEGIDRLSTDSMPQNIRPYYWGIRHYIYMTAAEVVNCDTVSQKYYKQSINSLDSILTYLKEGGSAHLYFKTLRFYESNDREGIKKYASILADTVINMPMSHQIYSRATKLLGKIAMDAEDDESAIRYFTLSSIADIKNGRRDSEALNILADILVDTDENRAYHYYKTAIALAIKSGSRIRVSEYMGSAFFIDRMNRRFLLHQQIYWSCGLIVLVALITFLAFRVYTRRKRNIESQKDIKELKKGIYMQNESILQFMTSYARLMEMYENMGKLVSRKIKAKQTADITAMIDSEEYITKAAKQFATDFDQSFLSLQPDFITRVNTLLAEDRKFNITDHEKSLTPELRLLALISLGITDSQVLSHLLNLSLNTVYAYRTRLKNRALDRNNFEDLVKNLN